MTDPAPDVAALEALVAQLADQIAARLGPEQDSVITAHLARLAARVSTDPLPSLERAHAALQAAPGAPELGRGRGASAAAIQQLTDEVAAHRAALDALLKAVGDSIEPGMHRHPDLEGELDALHDRFTQADRHRAWTATDLDVSTRLSALEAAHRATAFEPWFSSQRFTEAFRGEQQALDDRYADLADVIAERDGPVLDLGCGAGDLLRLLAARGVDARGVDSDAESVRSAVAQGLTVEEGDALAVLSAEDTASLGVVVLIQVVEHLAPQQLVELIALTADKIRPGGLLVAETINPASLYVYSHALYLDPTHTTPIHPLYLSFLCQEAGFAAVDVHHRSVPPDAEKLLPVQGTDATLVDGVNRTIERLNDLLFGPQDYVVLATR